METPSEYDYKTADAVIKRIKVINPKALRRIGCYRANIHAMKNGVRLEDVVIHADEGGEVLGIIEITLVDGAYWITSNSGNEIYIKQQIMELSDIVDEMVPEWLKN